MTEPTKTADKQHLRRYGYAPGNYMNTCCRCSGVADLVDKYARTCLSCAEEMHKKDTVAKPDAGIPISAPPPDCRTCDHYERFVGCYSRTPCINGSHHKPRPPLQLWRNE